MKFTSIIALSLVIFCGCKSQTTTPAHKEKELRAYLQGEPFSLDPRIGATRSCQVYIRELFEGLTRISKEGKPELAVAKSVDISTDGCTYCFHLNKSYWSNGDEVSAYDFEYAWKSILSPNFPSSYSYAFFLIKGAREAKLKSAPLDDVGIQAIDPSTLIVTLCHPAPYFLELTANPLYSPISKKVAEQNPDWSKNGGDSFVSNGPFTLESWKHQSEFTLRKNPFYLQKNKVKLDTIHVAIIDTPQTALDLFDRGEFDIIGEPFGTLPLDATITLLNEKKLKTQEIEALYWLEVNTTHPLLSSKKVRQALASAINREELTRHLLQGGEKPAFSIVPEQLSSLKEPLFKDNDKEKAIALFNEGLQELGLTKESIPPLTITHWADPKEKAIAAALQQTWSQVFQIPVTIVTCDWNSLFKKISSGDYHIAGVFWYTWYQDPIYNLELLKYKASGLNGTGWEDPRYIDLLNSADLAVNVGARNECLGGAEQLAMEEMPLIPIFSQTCKFLHNDRVQGFYITPVGQIELLETSILTE